MIYLESIWEAEPLSKLGKRVTGVTYKKAQSSEEYVDEYVPLLKANNIQNHQILFDDFVYVPPDLVKEEKKIKKNDILIAASSGSLNVVGKAGQIQTEWDGSFGAFCKVLRPIKEKVDPKYLAYFFHTNYYRSVISHLASGANINNINNSHFDELFVPLPPLETQKKIAAVLDKADALRQKRRQTIEKLDELTQSVFLDMFGDSLYQKPNAKLDELLEIKHGNAFKSSWFTEVGDIPVVKIGTVNKTEIDFSDIEFLDESYKEEYSKYLVYPGDLMLSMTGTVGKDDYANPCILTDKYPEYFLNQRVVNIQFDKSRIKKSFLYFLFKQRKIKGQLVKLSRGIRQANVSNKDIYEIEINVPSIVSQEKFEEIFSRIDRNKSECEKSLTSLDRLFNSLLQKAFKGELNFTDNEEQLLAAEEAAEYSAR